MLYPFRLDADLHAGATEEKHVIEIRGEVQDFPLGNLYANRMEDIAAYYRPVEGKLQFDSLLDFPLQIAGVRRGEDAIASVVRGCLIAAALSES